MGGTGKARYWAMNGPKIDDRGKKPDILREAVSNQKMQ